METKNNKGAAVQGNGTAVNHNAQTSNKSNQPGATAPKTDNHSAQGESKAAAPKAPEVQAPAKPAEQHEVKKLEPVANVVQMPKAVMSIDERIKTLEMLQILKGQYYNLLKRIDDLENFEFMQLTNADELQENAFAGCTLILQDGNGGRFTTTTPNLIKITHAFLLQACLDKKDEIENQIVFPAASAA